MEKKLEKENNVKLLYMAANANDPMFGMNSQEQDINDLPFPPEYEPLKNILLGLNNRVNHAEYEALVAKTHIMTFFQNGGDFATINQRVTALETQMQQQQPVGNGDPGGSATGGRSRRKRRKKKTKKRRKK